MEMIRKPHVWIALLVLVAIAIIVIAPSVDLAPAALRAWQAACAIFVAMAAVVRTYVSTSAARQVSDCSPVPPYRSDQLPASAGAVFNCVLLC